MPRGPISKHWNCLWNVLCCFCNGCFVCLRANQKGCAWNSFGTRTHSWTQFVSARGSCTWWGCRRRWVWQPYETRKTTKTWSPWQYNRLQTRTHEIFKRYHFKIVGRTFGTTKSKWYIVGQHDVAQTSLNGYITDYDELFASGCHCTRGAHCLARGSHHDFGFFCRCLRTQSITCVGGLCLGQSKSSRNTFTSRNHRGCRSNFRNEIDFSKIYNDNVNTIGGMVYPTSYLGGVLHDWESLLLQKNGVQKMLPMDTHDAGQRK